MLTGRANCVLTARTQLHQDVFWRPMGITFRTMGADRNLRQMGGIFLIPVPLCCAQMATTIQVEAVGYFRMVDTLALNNRHSLDCALERKGILPKGE